MQAARDPTALIPVSTATRREVVVNAMRRALLTGELRPGQRLKEAQLAEALGVSRPTIREAIYQLVHEGALVQTPYKGITVATPSAQDLLDVAEVRVSLETQAALHVVKHQHGEGMARLNKAFQAHLDALERGDTAAAAVTHLELHRTLWEGSENQMIMRIWPLLESQIRMAVSVDQAARSDPERDGAFHRRLIAVIERGDEDEIRAEVRAHIAVSADEIVAVMEQRQIS